MVEEINTSNAKFPIELEREFIFILDCIKIKYGYTNRNDAIKKSIDLVASNPEIEAALKVMGFEDYKKRLQIERERQEKTGLESADA